MRNKTTWTNRYKLAISETITLREIELLLDCGQPKAIEVRQKAIEYCSINNIEMYSRCVPTEAVLKVIRKDIDYYYDKMLLETKIVYA